VETDLGGKSNEVKRAQNVGYVSANVPVPRWMQITANSEAMILESSGAES